MKKPGLFSPVFTPFLVLSGMLWECDVVTLLVKLSSPKHVFYLLLFFKNYFILSCHHARPCVHDVCADMRVMVCVWRSEDSCVKSVLSVFMWVLEIELRSSGLGHKESLSVSHTSFKDCIWSSFLKFVLNSLMTLFIRLFIRKVGKIFRSIP